MIKHLLKLGLISVLIAFIHTRINSQVPQAISFQGIATDGNDLPLIDQTINIEVKIIQGSISGQTMYSETHLTETNQNGLYSLSIGLGNVQFGAFAEIDWANTPMFVSVGIDLVGGNSFTHIGTSQLLSVPYALMANKSNIEPKIFVSNIPHTSNENLIVFNYNSSVYFYNYYYSWIQGNPETVYVEYKNIPFDFYFEVSSIETYPVSDYFKNFSGVDTIYGGLMRTNIRFRRADSSYISKGTFPFYLVFRTKDDILDTLYRSVVVKDTYFDDCFGDIPSTKYFLSTDCHEIEDSINQSIILDINSVDEMSISNIIGNNCNATFSFYSLQNCANIAHFNNCQINEFNVRIKDLTKENENIIFGVRIADTNTGEEHQCNITYE